MHSNKPTLKSFMPPFDVIEMDEQVVILVEIAGMQADDFSITMRNDRLTISGVRHKPPFNARAFHQVEIGFGEFRIDVAIPWTIQVEAINAAYHEGFLQIELPRKKEMRIQIVDTNKQAGSTSDDDQPAQV